MDCKVNQKQHLDLMLNGLGYQVFSDICNIIYKHCNIFFFKI